MPKRVFLREMNRMMEETLQGGGEVAFTPAGHNMLPMLRSRQDKIVLVQAPNQLKKFDIPLYRRGNGQFVLHRVIDIKKDGYVLCGDHQWQAEYGVRHEQIIGVVKAFYRGDKYIDCTTSKTYHIYCRIWTYLIPARSIFSKLRGCAEGLRNKLNAKE